MTKFRKILLAEDDEDDRMIFEEIVRQLQGRHDFDFEMVENGSRMIQLLDTLSDGGDQLPALIVLDQNMPQMSGQEALAYVKASPLLSDIPVVIFSTYNDNRLMKECIQLGAVRTITKPDSYEGFHDVIELLVTEFVVSEK